MSTFRLERLLTLRAVQEAEAKAHWARAEALVREAIAAQERGKAAVARAFQEFGSREDHKNVVATLAAYDRLDALQSQTSATAEAVHEAQRRAADARTPYEHRRREVEALRRLKDRWAKEQRKERRRRENREQEAFIQRRATRGASGTAGLTAHSAGENASATEENHREISQ